MEIIIIATIIIIVIIIITMNGSQSENGDEWIKGKTTKNWNPECK